MGGTGASLGSVAAKKKAAKVWVSGAEHPPDSGHSWLSVYLPGLRLG